MMKNRRLNPALSSAGKASDTVVMKMVDERIKRLREHSHTHLEQIEATVQAFTSVVMNVGAMAETSRAASTDRQAYLDNLFQDPDDEDYFPGLRLNLATVIKSINPDLPPHEFTLNAVVAGDAFRKMVMTLYEANGLSSAFRCHLGKGAGDASPRPLLRRRVCTDDAAGRDYH